MSDNGKPFSENGLYANPIAAGNEALPDTGNDQKTVILQKTQEALQARDQLIELIVYTSPLVLFALDCEGIFTLSTGKSLNKVTGGQEILGHSIYEVYKDYPQMLKNFERARAGESFSSIVRIGQLAFDTRYEPIRDEQAAITGAIGVAMDVSERLQAEESLRQSEERYRLVIDSVKDYAIYMLDPEGRVTSWNTGAQAIIGYKAEEIIGEHFSRFYTPEDQAAHKPQRGLNEAQTKGRFEEEGWRMRKDGSRFWASVLITPLYDQRGTLSGFSKVIRDITRRRAAEEGFLRQAGFVKLLQEVAVAANEAISVNAALQFALDRICEHTGWKVGHAFVLDPATNELVTSGIWHMEDKERFKTLRQYSESTRFAPDMGLPGKILASGLPTWITDMTQDPVSIRQDIVREAQIKTGVALPVLTGKKVVGALEFFTDEAAAPDEQLLDVMAHIGAQLGRVIERKHAEEALRQSEERFRIIFEGAALGAVLINLDGRILECNSAICNIFGYSAEELRRINLEENHHPANMIANIEEFKDLRTGQLDFFGVEKPFIRKDGHLAWAHVAVSLVKSSQNEPQYAIGLFEDITERKQMETDLIELQRSLMEGREAERLHLAQELHDGPVQELYGLSYHLKAISADLPDGNSQTMKEMQTTLNLVIGTLRTICRDMRPPTLAPFGLEKAIRSHAETFQEEHPDYQVELDLMADAQRLPERTRLALFRIYQQMLVNVVRHAKASKILVRFKFDEEHVILEIIDNGEGFILPSRWIELAREGHLGLVGAAERAESIGGKLHIESAPGKGTTVRVVAPRS